ncbi:hypothetical protein GGF46_004789 [Coemansia sp. RSA 552]|nr:hypothetical protein GGF46_004789 [Coemansia sp. RSA 552]
MSSVENPHGILGHWAVVGHGFNIGSICASGVVIGSFAFVCMKEATLLKRISFRISAWIAACDVIYSVCQLCVFNNDYMSSLSETSLRVIHWLMSASVLSFAFLCASVGVHLILSVLTKHVALGMRTQWYSEYISIFLGFFITHPFLYLYKEVAWASDSQAFYINVEDKYYRVTSWLTMWAWLFTACIFLMVVGILVSIKMLTFSRSMMDIPALPEGDECTSDCDDNDAHTITPQVPKVSPERARQIRSVTLRILLYSLVPIGMQMWVLVANMLTKCPMWLYVLANLIPATQGMINMLVFFALPAWDDRRRRLVAKITNMRPQKVSVRRYSDSDSPATEKSMLYHSTKVETLA